MKRTYIKDLKDSVGKEVSISGWVDVRRDHGKLIFIDIRDVSGKVQTVALPSHKEAYASAELIRPEWVVEIKGVVNKRPENMVKEGVLNGAVEIEIKDLLILNESKTPPFEITEDTSRVEENLRLKYRYLDLRTERLQENMKIRGDFLRRCREFLFDNEFNEFETPLLTETTEEGSRDFVVPSRLHPGKFYALPQSPQQYKELLMVAGFDRYFQMARAIRDEDLRADRGFEHTQVDIEMSFVNREEVMDFVEKMMTKVAEDMGYKILHKPFPKISYKDSMEKYGADKFDMRSEKEKEEGYLAYAWVVDFPLFEKTEEGGWTFSHNPFSMPKDEFKDNHIKGEGVENIISTQYDLVCNGFEVGGGSIRANKPEILEATYKIMGYGAEKIDKMIGHMMEAYSFGAPPHGGIALGVERIIMNLTNEPALREVQAFPMTRGGKTAVMEGPSDISEEQLKELGLDLRGDN